MSNRALFIGAVAILAVVLIVLTWAFLPRTRPEGTPTVTPPVVTPTSTATNGEPAILVPSGWYRHDVGSGVILTRQPELPDIGPTEGYAYGEQITFASERIDRSREEWIAQRLPPEEATSTIIEAETINGFPTVKAEFEVEADGKTLVYFLIAGDRAYIFSLYPLQTNDPVNGRPVRNTANVELLDRIVKDYAAKLSSV